MTAIEATAVAHASVPDWVVNESPGLARAWANVAHRHAYGSQASPPSPPSRASGLPVCDASPVAVRAMRLVMGMRGALRHAGVARRHTPTPSLFILWMVEEAGCLVYDMLRYAKCMPTLATVPIAASAVHALLDKVREWFEAADADAALERTRELLLFAVERLSLAMEQHGTALFARTPMVVERACCGAEGCNGLDCIEPRAREAHAAVYSSAGVSDADDEAAREAYDAYRRRARRIATGRRAHAQRVQEIMLSGSDSALAQLRDWEREYAQSSGCDEEGLGVDDGGNPPTYAPYSLVTVPLRPSAPLASACATLAEACAANRSDADCRTRIRRSLLAGVRAQRASAAAQQPSAVPPKRARGRPRKNPIAQAAQVVSIVEARAAAPVGADGVPFAVAPEAVEVRRAVRRQNVRCEIRRLTDDLSHPPPRGARVRVLPKRWTSA